MLFQELGLVCECVRVLKQGKYSKQTNICLSSRQGGGKKMRQKTICADKDRQGFPLDLAPSLALPKTNSEVYQRIDTQ